MGGARIPILPFPAGCARSSETGVGGPRWEAHGGADVADVSWFAFLRVGDAASICVADIRGEKALGFWATKRGIVGQRWRRWSKWSGAWGGYLRDCTKQWEANARVVPRGPPVYETALAGFLRGTSGRMGVGMGTGGGGRRGGMGPHAARSLVLVVWEVGR